MRLQAKHVSPLDQLLMDEDFPDAVRLETCVAAEQLEKVFIRFHLVIHTNDLVELTSVPISPKE